MLNEKVSHRLGVKIHKSPRKQILFMQNIQNIQKTMGKRFRQFTKENIWHISTQKRDLTSLVIKEI